MFTEAVPASVYQRAHFTAESLRLWQASRNRSYDTFIGLTDLQTLRFHMRPCVKTTDNPNIYESLFIGRRAGAPIQMRTSRIAAESFYGAASIIVVPHAMAGLPQGVDGLAHRTLCNRVGVPQVQCIGWAIKGNASPLHDSEAVFSSGRNIGKFPGVARPPGQGGRDLPDPWAQFVLEILRRYLPGTRFFVDRARWPTVH